MRTILVLLLLLLLISVSAYLYFQPTSYLFNHPVPSPTIATSQALSCEAFHVITPKQNATVSSPLEIEVIVDNSQKDCRWTVFEAQAGIIKLIDEKGTVLGENTLRTTDNWMTEAPVRYSTKIQFTTPKNVKKAHLVITEENPSGEGEPQTLTILVSL